MGRGIQRKMRYSTSLCGSQTCSFLLPEEIQLIKLGHRLNVGLFPYKHACLLSAICFSLQFSCQRRILRPWWMSTCRIACKICTMAFLSNNNQLTNKISILVLLLQRVEINRHRSGVPALSTEKKEFCTTLANQTF